MTINICSVVQIQKAFSMLMPTCMATENMSQNNVTFFFLLETLL